MHRLELRVLHSSTLPSYTRLRMCNSSPTRSSGLKNAAGKVRWTVEIAEPDTSSNTILGRHPSVLLVCSKSLQVLYGICLEQAGCRVDYAADHHAAIRLYRKHGPYDLVLADFLRFRELFTRVRKNDSEQALAMVGACSASTMRLRYKVPVLREGPRQRQLVRLVESAIKPQVRILFVVANPDSHWPPKAQELKGPEIEGDGGAWGMVVGLPESFEIELETDGNEALKRYRERGPYDLVLTEVRLPHLSGPDLAAAIRSENPTQRIVMITESSSRGSCVQQEVGDIPLLNTRDPRTIAAMKRARMMRQFGDGEGKGLLNWVEAGLKGRRKKTAKSRA